jgi:cephalosporin hydroxylase
MCNALIRRVMHNANPLKYVIRGRNLDKYTINFFHKLYHGTMGQTWMNTYWLGVPVFKCPMDLWVYQEIISNVRPDVIIECGTWKGGSALSMAHILDILDNGKVLTIDIDDVQGRPEHKRINYLLGSSTSEDIVATAKQLIRSNERVMVVLDSDHHEQHVLNELRIYSRFVSKGSYLIVEDTNLNGHPVKPDFGPGPMEAVNQFLKETSDFIVDKSKEKFYMTFNPNGYLIKVR